MIEIVYNPKDGKAISDGRAQEEMDVLIYYYNLFKTVRAVYSTENMIALLRLEVASGRLTPDDVMIEFEGENVEINKYGVIHNWPKGFCDLNERVSSEIIRHALTRRRSDKELGRA